MVYGAAGHGATGHGASGSGPVGLSNGRELVLEPVTVDGVRLLVAAVPVLAFGSENTSGKTELVVGRVQDAFDAAQSAIVAVAGKVAGTVKELALREVHLNEVQVEFGVSFSATGNVIVAGSTIESSLKVTLTFNARRQPAPGAAPDATHTAGGTSTSGSTGTPAVGAAP